MGAVLGQPGGALGPNTAAVDAGDTLVKSVFGNLHDFTLSPRASTWQRSRPWGSTATVTVPHPVSVIGWPGLVAILTVRHGALGGHLPSGTGVGTLQAGVGQQHHPRRAPDTGCALGAQRAVAPYALRNRRGCFFFIYVEFSKELRDDIVGGRHHAHLPPVAPAPRQGRWAVPGRPRRDRGGQHGAGALLRDHSRRRQQSRRT